MRSCLMYGLVLVMCLFALPCAAQDESLRVRRADGVGETVEMWEKSDGQEYLFLPTYMEGQPLYIEYEGIEDVLLGGMSMTSGAQTDAISGDAELTLVRGGKRSTLIVMASENLPAVHLSTQSGNLEYIHEKKGNKETGRMTVVGADGVVSFSGQVDHIKGHGNATFVYDKKSYQVKLDKKAALLGMGEGKTYVLLANQHENCLLRNRITFDLARAAGLCYTPECRSVDLYINGEYRGNYLLCDKVTISSGCVDITESDDAVEFANEALVNRDMTPQAYGTPQYRAGTYKGIDWPNEPQDVTGGYLFEMEYSQRYADEESGVVTERGQAVVVKSPEQMTPAQGEYAAALLNSFERAIFSEDGVDEETGRHYTQIADMTSLVSKFLIEEISKNYDGNKSSQYFYKDSDSVDPLLYAGPVWDYDSAWGNYAREERLSVAAPRGIAVGTGGQEYAWWPALYAQEDFLMDVRITYREVFEPLLQVLTGAHEAWDDCPVMALASYEAELEASAQMNFVRWRVLNHDSRAVKTGETYAENIEYLRAWITERMAYLDTQWAQVNTNDF